MRNLRYINIICNESENENFLFFAEFFKLCGVYVIKSIGDLAYASGELEKYGPSGELDIRNNYRWLENKSREQSIFKDALEVICNQEMQLLEELSVLADIYIHNGLMRHSMMERYFYAPKQERVRTCIEGFESADAELKKLKVSGVHSEYFKIICRHKINVLRGKLKEKKSYDSGKLIRAALELCEKNPEFVHGYVLAGLISDGDLQRLTYSIVCYDKASEHIDKNEQMRAYIDYRKGRYYEKISHDVERALKSYKRAYELAEHNYRILFKIALLELDNAYIYQDERYARNAKDEFYKLYWLMCKDLENHNLEPIQLEYLAKTYKALYKIYDIWLEREDSANQILKKLSSLDQVIRSDTFFDNVFKEQANIERELLIQHLDIDAYKHGGYQSENNKKGNVAYAK